MSETKDDRSQIIYSRKDGKKYTVDWQNKEYLLEFEHQGRYRMIHNSILDDELYEYWKADLAALEEAEERWIEEEIQLQSDPDYQQWLAEQYEYWYENEKKIYMEYSESEIQHDELDEYENNAEEDNDEFVPILDEMVEIDNDFDAAKVSAFPIQTFPPVISDHIKEISRMFSIPYEFSAVPTLVAISTAIGNNVTLKFNESLNQKAILYCCLVSQSSSGKSPAQKLVLAPLVQEQSKREKEYKKLIAEFLANQKKKESAEDLEEPVEPEDFITTNVTVEKMVEMLQKNSKGIIIACDEFMNFYKNLNSYKNGGGDTETYLSIWSNAYIKANRLSRKTSGVDSPYVNIIGNLTPSSLNKLGENDNLDNGFIHRLLFSCPLGTEMVRTSEKGIDQTVSEKYNQFIVGLHRMVDEKTITMSPGAKNVYLQYENFVSKKAGNDERLRSSYSKIKEYSLRFALILHISGLYSDHRNIDCEVSKETMADAIRISEYFRSQVKILYNQLSGNTSPNKTESKLEKAINFLKKQQETKITKRELCRGIHIKTEEADESIIPELLQKKIIKVIDKKNTPRGESVTYEIVK
ncbi:DUF3987 domain-containing protein [Psychrobacillus sp. PGGUH221]|uniref:DUF3987 domain-containing protein n=1 Tax=Psychrobacillus sp. PGGUH221 TaxID=3020058 RepID=UPI0035C74A2A